MAEEEKKKKPAPKKKNGKVDKATIIFFAVMVVGLVVLTIVILTRPSSKIYMKNYGDDIVSAVEVYSNNKVDIAVDIQDNRVVQSGTYKEIDDDIEGNYTVTFVDSNGIETHVDMLIEDDTLTLTYDDGTKIEYKENTNGDD